MKYLSGDILTVQSGYILQQCNCIGIKPRGLSYDLNKTFPDTCPYKYRRSQDGKNAIVEDHSTPGTVAIYQSKQGPIIINLFGQYSYGGPKENRNVPDTAEMREKYFKQGLNALVEFFLGTDELVRIAVPFKIGCGLAQGYWPHYEQMLVQFEKDLLENGIDIELTVYRK